MGVAMVECVDPFPCSCPVRTFQGKSLISRRQPRGTYRMNDPRDRPPRAGPCKGRLGALFMRRLTRWFTSAYFTWERSCRVRDGDSEIACVADGFVVYCCGPKAAPFALVAAYQWADYVDLVTIRCFDRVTTARVPAPHHGRFDVLAPQVVVWACEGPPQRALRALLDLIHPQHPDAPARAYPAPPSLHIPALSNAR